MKEKVSYAIQQNGSTIAKIDLVQFDGTPQSPRYQIFSDLGDGAGVRTIQRKRSESDSHFALRCFKVVTSPPSRSL